jgi:hypothetical protein
VTVGRSGDAMLHYILPLLGKRSGDSVIWVARSITVRCASHQCFIFSPLAGLLDSFHLRSIVEDLFSEYSCMWEYMVYVGID